MVSEELLTHLANEIDTCRVVAVVGAGVSVAVTGDAPTASWIGLLRHGVDHVMARGRAPNERWRARQHEILDEAATGSGDLDDLLSVAEQVSQRLGATVNDGEWRAWLQQTVGELRPRRPALIEAIADLCVPIATTNYDGLVEAVTGLPALTWRNEARAIQLLRGDERGALHLHGYWEQPETVVLGIRSYDKLLNNSLPQHLEKAIPNLHSLLFIGCGATLQDPNFTALRNWIRDNLASAEHHDYRLAHHAECESLKKNHTDERTFLLDYGPNYSDLEPFLRDLKQRISRIPSRAVRATQIP